MKQPPKDRYLIPSLVRAIEVLGLLGDEKDGLSLSKLNRRSETPKSTLFRILVTLEKFKWVVWDEERKAYRLGVKVWELGHQYLANTDLMDEATPYLRELAEELGESVFLGRLDEGEVIYVRRVEAPKSVTVVRKLGKRVPAHCTATGEAMMAFLPEEEVQRIIDDHGLQAFNPNTVTDVNELKARLSKIRQTGYAVVDGEYNSDLLCISSPVLNYNRHPVASITVAVLSSQAQADKGRVDHIASKVRNTAAEVSRAMGYVSESVPSNSGAPKRELIPVG